MASNSGLRASNRFERQHIPPPPPPHHASSSNSRSVNSQSSARPKVPSSKRSVTPNSRTASPEHTDPEHGRVRVAVRLRPRTAEDLLSDADFADCVEIQPELKRLKLRKNNWSSESYRFDEVFAGSASQKRVYEVVAKPVVESVLDGYNGTIMAYGQTGTGKTYTLGRLGKDDVSERGIMVRALEDIIANTSTASDCLEISYLQLYMESVQDLLAPEKINIPIVEDPKSGEVSVPGAAVVKIQNLDQFLHVLQVGEANRHAANTKMNTESSRSHAILMVYVRRSVKEETDISILAKDTKSDFSSGHDIPMVRKSKLLIVDLAGSERLDKSGSEGHTAEETKFINLSLTSLGKCINALAENSPHIPTRDSKLTRLLRDSFGGTARTSLIITIGPSSRHHAETTSTIMFGQRAMKVVNMVKLKEEFDYESLCRKLENKVDTLTAEIDRQLKLRENEKASIERRLEECQNSFAEAEKSLVARSEIIEQENTRLEAEMKGLHEELKLKKDHNDMMHAEVERLEQHQLEDTTYQKVLAETTQMYEKKITELMDKLGEEHTRYESAEEQSDVMKKKVAELLTQLEDKHAWSESAEIQLDAMKMKISDLMIQLEYERDRSEIAEKQLDEMKFEISNLRIQLENEHDQSENTEEQLERMKKLLSDHQKSIQMERITHQKELSDATDMYEEKIANLIQQLADERACFEAAEEELVSKQLLNDSQNVVKIQEQKEIDNLRIKLKEMSQLHDLAVDELRTLKSEYSNVLSDKATMNEEMHVVRQALLVEERRRKTIENELANIKNGVPESEDEFEDKKSYMKENIANGSSAFGKPLGSHKSNLSRQTISGQKTTIAKICEEVGLQKILGLLTSEDIDVQIHAVKVVANLAAEDINQEKIVEEGGLDALLMLLRSSNNTTILRVASGAVANLAMNEKNQSLITSKGGARLLANTASRTDDPQTLRMVAGAIANLCGNERLHVMLREGGGIRALLGMVKSGNSDVIAQVARGIANFAKCETRGIIQGHRRGHSLLIEDGVLLWLITNSNTASTSTRRHIELALCHLAQNAENAKEFVSSGALKELARISVKSTREDIRNLAKKTLKYNPLFQAQIHAQ